MTTNHKDPLSYLNSLISKRGKSGPDGVYLTNLTIVAEANTDYDYKVNYRKCGARTPLIGTNYTDWIELLVNLREDNPQTPQTLPTDSDLVPVDSEAIYQFVPEGGMLSLNVFMPYLDTQLFEHLVCSTQDMLTYVAGFAGKIPSHIRFSIGYATSKWGDLAESGEVEEYDLSY